MRRKKTITAGEHNLVEDTSPMRDEAAKMTAELFKLAFLRYGNMTALRALMDYIATLQPDELRSLISEAEEQAANEVAAVDQDVGLLIGYKGIDLASTIQQTSIQGSDQVH